MVRCPVRSLTPPYRGRQRGWRARGYRCGGTQRPFLRLSDMPRQPFYDIATLSAAANWGSGGIAFTIHVALILAPQMALAFRDLF